ncbi:unnamed protein product [Rotaria sp. Silwood1]|nr:unnamed protein product [Rotaria sp. Silwood1]
MNQHIQPDYDPNLHGGIFPLYMTIQNLIQGDPEYGKYFWLGICLYDDRVLMNVQLLYMNQHIQPDYDPNLHGGIFPLYMTIQNLIQGDPEYGKYFWLGICLYDDRVLMSSLYVNGDIGTGSLIYSPAFSNFANISVHSELTGLNNGTIEIGNLNLKQYTAQNPKSYEFNCDGDAEGWKQISDLRQYTNSSWNGI